MGPFQRPPSECAGEDLQPGWLYRSCRIWHSYHWGSCPARGSPGSGSSSCYSLTGPTPIHEEDLEEELDEEQAGEDEEVEVLCLVFSVLNISFDVPSSQDWKLRSMQLHIYNKIYLIQKKTKGTDEYWGREIHVVVVVHDDKQRQTWQIATYNLIRKVTDDGGHFNKHR